MVSLENEIKPDKFAKFSRIVYGVSVNNAKPQLYIILDSAFNKMENIYQQLTLVNAVTRHCMCDLKNRVNHVTSNIGTVYELTAIAIEY
ncbi:hypothetical protein [Pseudoalteromonas phage B8b]|uniref:Uncharacterized protein n=1 Tax=Pseudoalteromonas phage B8b TaxID=1506997 RepID=A0A076G8C2_9CAUD|nr:hypothetical protein [Pseudoalteromonas phage B8b]|tara:strand:- start:272 stop:538 length:267 start_codon:yes stop_codon:yes gene_type:complete